MPSIRIGINPSVIEEKTIACQLLCDYVDELHEDYYPWIDQVCMNILACISYKLLIKLDLTNDFIA